MGEYVDTTRGGERKSSRGSERIGATPKADINSRKFKSAVTRAHNYTQDNFHGEASATMAKAFGYNDIADGLKQINKEHNQMGYLGGDLGERRNRLEDELEKRVKKDYGAKGIAAWNRAKS